MVCQSRSRMQGEVYAFRGISYQSDGFCAVFRQQDRIACGGQNLVAVAVGK